MSALYWPAERQTPDRRHPVSELHSAGAAEARMIEDVRTATSKTAACHLPNLMIQNLMIQNSNQQSPHRVDWSDVAFSEWSTCRGCLCEGQNWDDGS
jgi:hypothetical protein